MKVWSWATAVGAPLLVWAAWSAAPGWLAALYTASVACLWLTAVLTLLGR